MVMFVCVLLVDMNVDEMLNMFKYVNWVRSIRNRVVVNFEKFIKVEFKFKR